MTSALVDSNVILDFVDQASAWAQWSAVALRSMEDQGPLVINAVIYAEATVLFATQRAFEISIPQTRFIREPIPMEAAFLAGKVHLNYRRGGGLKDRTLSDFLIGAHASVKGYRILTRDSRRYRTYFPELIVIAPDSHP